MIELEHSPLGGSGANRWLNCAGSFLLQRALMLAGEYEQPPQSEYADKGTAAHELGAMCLSDNREPYEFIGQKIGRYTVHPDDLDPDAVGVYVATCEAIAAGGWGGSTIVEQTIHLPELHALLKGTVDFGHWRLSGSNPGCWLIDYKNGEGIGVSAIGNPQLLYYAFLLVAKFPELHHAPRDFPFHLGIVQPNFYGLFEEPEIWTTTLDEVLRFGFNVLLPRMEQLTESDPDNPLVAESDFVPGDHCQFCPVMLECPKLRAAFETYAYGEEFIEMMSDKELSELYELRDHARRYGNELEKIVFARLIGGKQVQSAKLVEKRVHRVWKTGAEPGANRKAFLKGQGTRARIRVQAGQRSFHGCTDQRSPSGSQAAFERNDLRRLREDAGRNGVLICGPDIASKIAYSALHLSFCKLRTDAPAWTRNL